MTKLELDIGGKVLTARLLVDQAPKTCSDFLHILPIEKEAVHALRSGEVIKVQFTEDEIPSRFKPENRDVYGRKGEIFWFPGMKPHQEIFIVYDHAQFSSSSGPILANLFAKIEEDLNLLHEIGTEIHRKGSKRITIKVKEP